MTPAKKISVGPLQLDLDQRLLSFRGERRELQPQHCIALNCLSGALPFGATQSDVVSKEDIREALGRTRHGTDGASLSSIFSVINDAILDLVGSPLVEVKSRSRTGYYLRINYPMAADTAGDSKPRVNDLPRRSRARFAAPTDEAKAFAAAFNAGDKRIIGNVIEAYPHPFLGSSLAIRNTGWSPNQIHLHLKQGLFNATEILSDPIITTAFEAEESDRVSRGLGSALQGDNNPKYGIVDVSSPFHDVSDLKVMLQQTDYFTVLRARPGIAHSHKDRMRFGHIEPYKSRIPQAVSVQFLALFADGNILTIRRGKDTYPWPGTWSFSGEEQCAQIDLAWSEQTAMEQFLLRTAVEEIFPLAQPPTRELLEGAIANVKPYVRSMRVWSIFLEEPTAIFQFFAVFELDLDVRTYVDTVHELIQEGPSVMSQEGRYFTASVHDIEDLLGGNVILARPLFGIGDEEILPEKLHPTSRYRLLRFLDYHH